MKQMNKQNVLNRNKKKQIKKSLKYVLREDANPPEADSLMALFASVVADVRIAADCFLFVADCKEMMVCRLSNFQAQV